ncbi:uncharacterized protein HD556DRAFT_1309361 [Suillus plorans]|uniref:Uncharacterized protein n=1 Tax=Suillus plorans TaxID=116603 RepID=A0A9P7DGB0_9AGAM|nr:uncharacterized protein HD556DRAFT_1309361 [Suillus plorans]KAG1792284.1 hypothetical protein HD556DRAFT_1309361 [Suillus plorans]
MSHPFNRPYPGKVRFETPMETDESAYSSEAGTPPVNVSGPRFNLGMSLPATQPPLALRFNFGMDLDMPAVRSATPPTPRFNIGMNLSIPGAVPPSSPPPPTQQPFNLGFTLPQPAQQPAPRLFNLGFNLAVPSKATPPPTTSSQLFNFGFNLPHATPLATSSGQVPAQEDTLRHTLPQPTQQPAPKLFNLGFNLSVQSKGTLPPTTSSQPFNFGFNLPHATPPPTNSEPVPDQAETLRHVGYDINNRSFQFRCEPPSLIGEWQPELIKVPQPTPPVASSPPAIADVGPGPSMPHGSSPPAIEDAAPGPSMPRALPLTGKHLERPTVGSLVGDAERAAINNLRRLGGEEFDHLAQMMVGAALGPGDDVRDPNPDEVLQSNKVMLLAFFETRDRLTRIFKDLISLHHLAKVHERVLPVNPCYMKLTGQRLSPAKNCS